MRPSDHPSSVSLCALMIKPDLQHSAASPTQHLQHHTITTTTTTTTTHTVDNVCASCGHEICHSRRRPRTPPSSLPVPVPRPPTRPVPPSHLRSTAVIRSHSYLAAAPFIPSGTSAPTVSTTSLLSARLRRPTQLPPLNLQLCFAIDLSPAEASSTGPLTDSPMSVAALKRVLARLREACPQHAHRAWGPSRASGLPLHSSKSTFSVFGNFRSNRFSMFPGWAAPPGSNDGRQDLEMTSLVVTDVVLDVDHHSPGCMAAGRYRSQSYAAMMASGAHRIVATLRKLGAAKHSQSALYPGLGQEYQSTVHFTPLLGTVAVGKRFAFALHDRLMSGPFAVTVAVTATLTLTTIYRPAWLGEGLFPLPEAS